MGVNCSYAVGATQISYQQADSYSDDVLGQSYTDFAASTSLDAASDFDNTDIYAGWSAFIQAVQTVFMFRSVDDPSTFLQDGTEYQLLVDYLRSGRYIGHTFHGVVAFNEYGQNEGRDPTTLQTQADGIAEVVFPSDFAEGIFSYPAPVGEECPDTHSSTFKGCLLCERVCTVIADPDVEACPAGSYGSGGAACYTCPIGSYNEFSGTTYTIDDCICRYVCGNFVLSCGMPMWFIFTMW